MGDGEPPGKDFVVRTRVCALSVWESNCILCPGCTPRQAANRSRLCELDLRRLGEDIAVLPELHAALAQTLAYGQGGGEKSSNKPGSRVPNTAAMEQRVVIRHRLASWAQLVIEERDWNATPADNPTAIANFLAIHVDWLANHEAAGDCADEFAETAGKARRVAYPNGTRTYEVAPCPMDCEGVIKAVLRRVDSLLPSELVCDTDEQHRWNSTQWVRLGRTLLKAAA